MQHSTTTQQSRMTRAVLEVLPGRLIFTHMFSGPHVSYRRPCVGGAITDGYLHDEDAFPRVSGWLAEAEPAIHTPISHNSLLPPG